MDHSALVSLGQEALWLVLLTSAIPVLASAAAGLFAGVLQAATQLQDPVLAVVPRLLAAAAALALGGPWMASQFIRFSTALLVAVQQVSS